MPLSQAKQVALNSQKRSQRLVNERYFRKHPELRTMTKAFLASMLEKRPDDVGEFATNFFGQSDRTPRTQRRGAPRIPTPEFCRCSTAPAAPISRPPCPRPRVAVARQLGYEGWSRPESPHNDWGVEGLESDTKHDVGGGAVAQVSIGFTQDGRARVSIQAADGHVR